MCEEAQDMQETSAGTAEVVRRLPHCRSHLPWHRETEIEEQRPEKETGARRKRQEKGEKEGRTNNTRGVSALVVCMCSVEGSYGVFWILRTSV